MPDALSKTIPIWCSVINRVLFPSESQFHELYTPPRVVSNTEHAQIFALLPSFEASLKALDTSLDTYKRHISKPLRPVWVTPDSDISSTQFIFEAFHPVICCTVSRHVAGGELSEGGYIQGAGDDTENWAHGLTPSVFWSNRETLFSTPESDLPETIEALVKQAVITGSVGGGALRLIEPTSMLLVTQVSAIATGDRSIEDLTIVLRSTITEETTWMTSATRLDVGLGPHKVGSRNLRAALPFVVDFIEKKAGQWGHQPTSGKRLIVACESGKDLAIGVALTLLCLFFDSKGRFIGTTSKPAIDKAFIRSRLGWVSTSMPDANPNRATLQSVNSFLMDRPR
jgi:tRNA A64-2'-O-ribosylphosphate transferase